MIDQKSMLNFHNSVVEFANSMSDEQLMGWEKAFRDSIGKPLVSASFKRSIRSGGRRPILSMAKKLENEFKKWLKRTLFTFESNLGVALLNAKLISDMSEYSIVDDNSPVWTFLLHEKPLVRMGMFESAKIGYLVFDKAGGHKSGSLADWSDLDSLIGIIIGGLK